MQTKNDRRLLANEGICLITHPEVALSLGKSEAIFLQQLHYWLTTDSEIGTVLDGQRWIYNSYKSWVENLRIYSESTIRRAVHKLEKMGIILTRNLNKKQSDHTKWYTINYDALKKLIPGLSKTKQERVGESKVNNGRLLKMNSPSVQNEQIIHKENKNYFRNNKISLDTKTVASLDSKETNTQKQQADLSRDYLQQMVSLWNQIVEEGQKTIELNSKRACFLKKAFETKFQSSLDHWKEFCKKIASSKFLMGEIKASFKASLDWVLKFDILQRILEGDFGIGDRTVYVKADQSDLNALAAEIEQLTQTQLIKQVRIAILNQFGSATYASWFKDSQITLENDQLVIKAFSSFARDYITRVFLDDMERIIKITMGDGRVKVE
jgi:hypothetical protein